MTEDIFADEWRECLRAHYMHVIRTNDKVTEPSLTVVMHQAGFNDSELAELQIRATMHVDSVSRDFVPDLDVLEKSKPTRKKGGKSRKAAAAQAPPPVEVAPIQAETPPPTLIEPVMAEPQPEESAVDETDSADNEALPEELTPKRPKDDPDAPRQLTLF